MEHWRWPDHDRYPGYNGTTTCKVYISSISKNLPRRTGGRTVTWLPNGRLLEAKRRLEAKYNSQGCIIDSRWLHDQALRSTYLSHKTSVEPGYYGRGLRAYLTLACVASVCVRFRRLIPTSKFLACIESQIFVPIELRYVCLTREFY